MAERALQNIQFAQAGEFERMDLLNRDVLIEIKEGSKLRGELTQIARHPPLASAGIFASINSECSIGEPFA